MIVKKIHFVIDNTNKAKLFGRIISKKNKNYPPKICDVIVVLGGDGFMLQTLKKFQKFNKPFYGINSGTFGFLMNKFKTYDVIKNISKAKFVSISPLSMKVITKTGKIYSNIAINEVSLLRQTRQTASLQISIGEKTLIKKCLF